MSQITLGIGALALGIGTLILVVFQVLILRKQTNIIDSQRKISEDELKYLIRKESPIIEVSKKTYDGDKIELYLFNGGKTKAVGVALKTEIYLINPDTKKVGDQIFISSRGDWDIKKQGNFLDGDKCYCLKPTIKEIFSNQSNYPELGLNQSTKFVQEVWFGLYDDTGNFPTPSKNITFKRLLTLLKTNKVLGCEIKISLIYKNLMGKVIDEIKLDQFYIRPQVIKSKFLSELNEEDKPVGGMRYVVVHPFKKQKYDISKSEEVYREIDHGER